MILYMLLVQGLHRPCSLHDELTNNFHISFLLVQKNILHFEIPN